jgi:hypothetical protein
MSIATARRARQASGRHRCPARTTSISHRACRSSTYLMPPHLVFENIEHPQDSRPVCCPVLARRSRRTRNPASYQRLGLPGGKARVSTCAGPLEVLRGQRRARAGLPAACRLRGCCLCNFDVPCQQIHDSRNHLGQRAGRAFPQGLRADSGLMSAMLKPLISETHRPKESSPGNKVTSLIPNCSRRDLNSSLSFAGTL